MKQSSLLDSFIKRQNKKASQPSNNLDSQQSINHIKKKNKKSFQVDSSDDEDSQFRIKQIEHQIQNIQFTDNDEFRPVDKNSYARKTENKPKSKSKLKNRAEKSYNTYNKKQKGGKDDDDPFSQFTDATPLWAQKQFCRDKQKRSPQDPSYDPTSLHVPEQAWAKFTAPMKQFWKIKSENFDKVILFKLGKFYQMFYDDAAIGNKYLNLKYMGTKMHAGFPEKCLDKYVSELVQLGFKTVVVQQMETPQQMQKRVADEKNKGRKSDKTINREVTQILTKGTFTSKQENEKVYLPNYLLSLRVHEQIYAFSLLQIASNDICFGIIEGVQNFKTTIFQTRPSQLVYDPDNLNFDLVRMMQKTFLNMQISKVMNKNNAWHPLYSIGEIDKLQKEGRMAKSRIFEKINAFQDTRKNLIYSTLSGLFQYLKKVFKFEYVIETIQFSFYQKESHTKNMILDSQALQHLQIFQTAEGQVGSLFSNIDRTKTKFGRRLLRKWLMSPLMNQFLINQRLNAIEDLLDNQIQRQKVVQVFKKLPDLDRKINILYHYAIKTSASKAIYFEDVNTQKLKQFKQIIQKMEEAWEAIILLAQNRKSFKSSRLKQLLTLAKKGQINNEQSFDEDEEEQSNFEGLLPNIIQQIQQFRGYIKWQDNTPIPQKGLVQFFDELQEEIERIKLEFDQYLERLRYQINQPNLKYVHTKQRYQIQIPEKVEKRKPSNFQFSSKRAGFSRYLCPFVKENLKRLQKVQEEVKTQMGLFIGFFFQQFKKKQKVWQRFVDVLAELDCFISLAEYSSFGSKIRPKFSLHDFMMKGAKHPCLTHIQFIPNDIDLKRKMMLLTGPNMGGKSTILRTVCTLVVLAQIGSYVPAQYYNCTIIDRIFTRIGASDKLQLGKSTFFIEMQETKSVLVNGTNRSLAIIDELGRGTSTFDGLAIAYSVLNEIVQNLKCFCLFATHYHILIDEFKNKQQIQMMMMNSIVKQNKIVFLYKLVPGSVKKSFGLSVAAQVGVENKTIQLAEEKAEQMNKFIESKRRAVFLMARNFVEKEQ